MPLAWLLLRMRRQGVAPRSVLGAYLSLTGAIRFLIEFLRVDVRVLGRSRSRTSERSSSRSSEWRSFFSRTGRGWNDRARCWWPPGLRAESTKRR